MEEVRRTNIILRVNKELHKDIKIAAAIRNISMSLLIHRAIYQYLRIDQKNESKLD
jgi:predicted HicB family RNase H-like nuclease